MNRVGFLYAPAHKELKEKMDRGEKTMRTLRRGQKEIPGGNLLALVKEARFCELRGDIEAEQGRRKKKRDDEIEAARVAGLLEECECCYSADILPADMVHCKQGHRFCPVCVSRSASVGIGEGCSSIKCLACEEDELGKAVSGTVLDKMRHKKQAEEVASAGLVNLVACPSEPRLVQE